MTIWRPSGGYGRANPRQSTMIVAPSSVSIAPWMFGSAFLSTRERGWFAACRRPVTRPSTVPSATKK